MSYFIYRKASHAAPVQLPCPYLSLTSAFEFARQRNIAAFLAGHYHVTYQVRDSEGNEVLEGSGIAPECALALKG